MYYATLGQKITPQWRTWVGYYREDCFSNLYEIGQADMDRELRNGLQWTPDKRNAISVINRYDLVSKKTMKQIIAGCTNSVAGLWNLPMKRVSMMAIIVLRYNIISIIYN